MTRNHIRMLGWKRNPERALKRLDHRKLILGLGMVKVVDVDKASRVLGANFSRENVKGTIYKFFVVKLN